MNIPVESLRYYTIQSISKNREIGLLSCNGKLFEIPSKWENGELSAEIDAKFIKKRCGGEKPYFIHTHIMHTSDPSDDDFIGYSKDIFNGFCVAGIDGYKCYNNEGKNIAEEKWGQEFVDDLLKLGGVKWEGKNLFCDRIGNDYYCELNGVKHEIIPMGIFQKLTTRGGKSAIEAEDADITIQTKFGEKFVCYADPKGLELSCFVKTTF